MDILIFTSILLIGIGAVSALDYNSTDDNLSFDENEVISIEENNSEVLNENLDDEIFFADDNIQSEIFSQNNNNNNSNEVVAISDDNEVLSVENTSNEISTIKDNSKVSSIQNENKNILSKTETHYDAEKGLNIIVFYHKIMPKI